MMCCDMYEYNIKYINIRRYADIYFKKNPNIRTLFEYQNKVGYSLVQIIEVLLFLLCLYSLS